jgi:hypothetical protein
LFACAAVTMSCSGYCVLLQIPRTSVARPDVPKPKLPIAWVYLRLQAMLSFLCIVKHMNISSAVPCGLIKVIPTLRGPMRFSYKQVNTVDA